MLCNAVMKYAMQQNALIKPYGLFLFITKHLCHAITDSRKYKRANKELCTLTTEHRFLEIIRGLFKAATHYITFKIKTDIKTLGIIHIPIL